MPVSHLWYTLVCLKRFHRVGWATQVLCMSSTHAHSTPTRKSDNSSNSYPYSGLFSFGSTTLILSFYNTGVRGITVPNVVVGMALFVGGLVQILAGMWEFAAGNTLGATGESARLSISTSIFAFCDDGSSTFRARSAGHTDVHKLRSNFLRSSPSTINIPVRFDRATGPVISARRVPRVASGA